MSTEVRPVPVIPLASDFPSNADRSAEVWNPKVVTWAYTSREMAAAMNFSAEAVYHNALLVQDAATQVMDARNTTVSAASRAEAARDRAVQAEQAIDQALVDGPVLSVDGQTGVVELHLNARMQATALLF